MASRSLPATAALTKTQWTDTIRDAPPNQLHPVQSNSRITTRRLKGGNSKGGVTSADTFNQWYKDVPGLNMSMALTITTGQAG